VHVAYAVESGFQKLASLRQVGGYLGFELVVLYATIDGLFQVDVDHGARAD